MKYQAAGIKHEDLFGTNTEHSSSQTKFKNQSVTGGGGNI